MRADEALEEAGIDFELVEHQTVESCREAAEARGLDTRQVVKSLIVERGGDVFHICVPGDRELSEKKFGEHRMAEPEKSRQLTGQQSGTVHPFSSDLKHFIDERVFEREKISHTVGNSTEGVIYNPKDFREALRSQDIDFEIRDLVVTQDRDLEKLQEKGIEESQARFLAEKSYRRLFLNLADSHQSGRVLDAIRKLHRQGINFSANEVEKLLERAEGEDHMLKLAESYAEQGEFPEEEKFELEDVVEKVVEENPKAVKDYRSGKDSAINYLLGEVMKQSQGRADAGKARQKILEMIE